MSNQRPGVPLEDAGVDPTPIGNRTRSKGKDKPLLFTSDPRKFAREERQKVREQEKLLLLNRITPDSIDTSHPLLQIDEQAPSAPIADTPQSPTAPIEYSHTPPANPFYESLKPKSPISPEIDVNVKSFPAPCGIRGNPKINPMD